MCHSNGKNPSLYIFVKEGVIKVTVVIIIEEYHCYLLHTNFYVIFLSEG